jgi:hypothetical protein
MIELIPNHNKMSMKPKGAQWYISYIGHLADIQVTNDTESSRWKYIIGRREGNVVSRSEYPTKEAAFTAALSEVARMVIRAKVELQEVLGVEL